MDADDLKTLLLRAVDANADWAASFGPFGQHPSTRVDPSTARQAVEALADRLRDNYPFFHPRYAGQMLKPPHPVAVAGYLAAMLVNPNAHALDGGPATAELEKQVVADLAVMFGLAGGDGPGTHLGHLTSSGTIANLEALFVARSIHPGKAIAFSPDAHYTHARMCAVLGVTGVRLPSLPDGTLDQAALERLLATRTIGTVVVTAGTTGLGIVEPVHEIAALARRFGVRVHVDAAYGGFFTLLAARLDPLIDPRPWQALAGVDSIVVDPHKHGLQPYGCGAVLFADPDVGRFYVHDSPYTYFTSDELHLGEISLECSRAGAAAAGLWTTLQVLPLIPDGGLGEVLAACRRAALGFAARLAEHPRLALYCDPQLDIVGYFDRRAVSTSAVDAASDHLLKAGVVSPDPVFVSTLVLPAEVFAAHHPHVDVDCDTVRIVRSVLMKPEQEDHLDWLVDRLDALLPAPARAADQPPRRP